MSSRFIARLANDDQDPQVVELVVDEVRSLLTESEQIEYVAVQKKPLVNMNPDCVVVTNRRFLVYRRRMFGHVSFDDYMWKELEDTHLREGVAGAELTFETTSGGEVRIDYLPKKQARRVYAFAQAMEEKMNEYRRQRLLEEKRAEAGGITMQSQSHEAPPSGPGSVTERMRQLNELRDAGLLSAEEYEAKRKNILDSL